MREALTNYIKFCQKQGFGRGLIIRRLLIAGWKQDEVDNAFEALQVEVKSENKLEFVFGPPETKAQENYVYPKYARLLIFLNSALVIFLMTLVFQGQITNKFLALSQVWFLPNQIKSLSQSAPKTFFGDDLKKIQFCLQINNQDQNQDPAKAITDSEIAACVKFFGVNAK